MDLAVPWKALVEMITPFYPEGRTGSLPFSLEPAVALKTSSMATSSIFTWA
jgi:hypothetical protein